MLGRPFGRGLSASQWLLLLLASFAVCEPSMVLRALRVPVRLTTPTNAEPEPLETHGVVATETPIARFRVRDVAALAVSRVPCRPESPLAPAWLASALISALRSGHHPLRC